MKLLRALLTGLLVLALACVFTASAPAQKDKDKDKDKNKKVMVDAGKLAGHWEVTFDSGNLGKGATFDFTKDGKVTINFTANGQATKVEADFTVDGTTITISSKSPQLKETRTVTAFSGKEMETDNSTGGHTKYSKTK
jgi:uncharacterized protein (TIGR03066 family)